MCTSVQVDYFPLNVTQLLITAHRVSHCLLTAASTSFAFASLLLLLLSPASSALAFASTSCSCLFIRGAPQRGPCCVAVNWGVCSKKETESMSEWGNERESAWLITPNFGCHSTWHAPCTPPTHCQGVSVPGNHMKCQLPDELINFTFACHMQWQTEQRRRQPWKRATNRGSFIIIMMQSHLITFPKESGSKTMHMLHIPCCMLHVVREMRMFKDSSRRMQHAACCVISAAMRCDFGLIAHVALN